MKKTILITLPLLFTACNNSTFVQEIANSKVVIKGNVEDGYINNSIVCLDLNSNNICEEDEPQSRTNYMGEYEIKIYNKTEDILKNSNLISINGTDTYTGNKYNGILKRKYSNNFDNNYINILTTFVAIKNKEVKNLKISEKIIANTLGIKENEINKDLIKEKNKYVFVKSIQLISLLKIVSKININNTYEYNVNKMVKKIFDNKYKSIIEITNEYINDRLSSHFDRNKLDLIIRAIDKLLHINTIDIKEKDLWFIQSKMNEKMNVLLKYIDILENEDKLNYIIDKFNEIENEEINNNVFRILSIIDIATTLNEKKYFYKKYPGLFDMNLKSTSTVLEFEEKLKEMNTMQEEDKKILLFQINNKREEADGIDTMYYKQNKEDNKKEEYFNINEK